MKRLIFILAFGSAINFASCSPSEEDKNPSGNNEQPGGSGDGNDGDNYHTMKMLLTIGSAVFTATLADNTAARAFAEMLPLTLDMEDVNRKEKHIRLERSLPTSATSPGTIRTGDLMLWGSDGIVLFYKTFSSSYSYTRLGTVDDPAGLEAALGTGGVTVSFELQ